MYFPDGALLADFLCRPGRKRNFPDFVQKEKSAGGFTVSNSERMSRIRYFCRFRLKREPALFFVHDCGTINEMNRCYIKNTAGMELVDTPYKPEGEDGKAF